MQLMDMVKRWFDAHLPQPDWSDTLWRSHTPEVRDTALNRTYERLDEHERELRESTARLEAELGALAPQRERDDAG
jgi:acyl-CoA reductase-like NAD-dependent aldehyde dehydrogenase